MILTESRSLAGVLRHIVVDYRARVASTNGQCGGFLRTNIAPQLKAGDRVIYLGDLDLSGGQIEGNTQDVLEREISGALAWERLALTKTQVREYDLPVIVKHDRRYKDGRPHEAVETEAISQRVLIDILQARLDALLPEPLTHVHEREAHQRKRLVHAPRETHNIREPANENPRVPSRENRTNEAANRVAGEDEGRGRACIALPRAGNRTRLGSQARPELRKENRAGDEKKSRQSRRLEG